jgi:hypothetical protein
MAAQEDYRVEAEVVELEPEQRNLGRKLAAHSEEAMSMSNLVMVQVRNPLMLCPAVALICRFDEFLHNFGGSDMVSAFGQNVGVDKVPDLHGQTKKR